MDLAVELVSQIGGTPIEVVLTQEVATLRNRIVRLETVLSLIDHTLRVPAAEYVPAIGDVFTIIDSVRKPTT